MRLITSAPYLIWELYFAAASRVAPVVRSTRWPTTVVVPTSSANPKFRSEVSPGSTEVTSLTSLRRPTVAVTRPSHFHDREDLRTSHLRSTLGNSRLTFMPICSGKARFLATASSNRSWSAVGSSSVGSDNSR